MESKYKKKEEKTLLTISLLVSNRKDTIRKCMESIKPLLEALPSELIAVDTGCTDGSIEIVKEYADLVVDFPWCHDFSAARNAGLEKAQGEWFLFLDDDEWFEDVTELIQFFQSGEYKKYGRAWYRVRNYLDWEGKEYKETVADRVFKRIPQGRFVGKVHEVYNSTGQKIKQLSSYVHHYGYVYKNEEEMKKHSERNVTLLIKQLEEMPDDIRMGAQLIQEYVAVGNYEEVRKWRNYLLTKTKKEHYGTVFFQYIVTSVLFTFRVEKNETALKQAMEEIVNTYSLTPLSRLVCIAEHILLLVKLEKKEEVLEELPQYFLFYNAVKQLGDIVNPELQLDRMYYKSDDLYRHLVEVGLRAAVSVKKKALIEEYLEKLEKSVDEEALAKQLNWYADILRKWYIREEEEGLLFEHYNIVLDNPQTKENAYNELEKLLLKYPKKRANLAEGFEALQRTEPLFAFLHLVYYLQYDFVEASKQALREYFATSKGKFDIYVVAFCLEQGKYMNELLHYIDFVTFKEGVCIWQGERDNEQKVELERLESNWDKKYALYFSYVKLVECERVLLEEKNHVTPVLLEYVDALVSYASLYHAKPLLQEENWCVLPRDCQFAFNVKKAFAAKEKGCTAEWKEYMKKAGKVYPGKISILQNVLQEETKKIVSVQISPEMLQLAEELKGNIRLLLKQGQKEAAKELIIALEQYVPGDKELVLLKSLLEKGI